MVENCVLFEPHLFCRGRYKQLSDASDCNKATIVASLPSLIKK